MLAKTPALVPIAQRLNGIGKALEDQVDTVRDKRCALIDRISRIKKSEIDWSSGEIKTQEHEGAKSLEAQTAAGSQSRASICCTWRIGRTNSGASCLLCTQSSAVVRKERAKDSGEGLCDSGQFQALFPRHQKRSSWRVDGTAGKKLRSYRFELVALDSFNQAEAAWANGGPGKRRAKACDPVCRES